MDGRAPRRWKLQFQTDISRMFYSRIKISKGPILNDEEKVPSKAERTDSCWSGTFAIMQQHVDTQNLTRSYCNDGILTTTNTTRKSSLFALVSFFLPQYAQSNFYAEWKGKYKFRYVSTFSKKESKIFFELHFASATPSWFFAHSIAVHIAGLFWIISGQIKVYSNFLVNIGKGDCKERRNLTAEILNLVQNLGWEPSQLERQDGRCNLYSLATYAHAFPQPIRSEHLDASWPITLLRSLWKWKLNEN